MQSYLVYIEISFINQLLKLYPELLNEIQRDMDKIATQFGGKTLSPFTYEFTAMFNDSPHHIADAARVMHTRIQKDTKKLYGAKICILPNNQETRSVQSQTFGISEEYGLWISSQLETKFEQFFKLTKRGTFFHAESPKKIVFRIEDKLPILLIRNDRLGVLKHALERFVQSQNNCLLLRGELGAGKRSTLFEAIHLHQANSFVMRTVPCSNCQEDPTIPFIRSLKNETLQIAEYLDRPDADWWYLEGEALLKIINDGTIWNRSSDQDLADLVKTFVLYFKGITEYYKHKSKYVYLIVDGFNPNIEATIPLMSALSCLLKIDGLRLIIICDSNDFSETIPSLGNGIEVRFREPSLSEWDRIISRTIPEKKFLKEDIKRFAEICGSNIYRLFYILLLLESDNNPDMNIELTLFNSLNHSTRETLFLAVVTAGFVNKSLLIERFSDSNEQSMESLRYETLMNLGFIREDFDGHISSFSQRLNELFDDNSHFATAASQFGAYLIKKRNDGYPIDLFQLAHFLKNWGPMEQAQRILEEFIDIALIKRRLILAKKFMEEKNNIAYDPIFNEAKLRLALIGNTPADLQWATKEIEKGIHHFSFSKTSLTFIKGQWKSTYNLARSSLAAFQRNGNHKGETYAHLVLGISQLAMGKDRDALNHFDIARRIGVQVNSVWGELRAISLRIVTKFLYGNLSLAWRECLETREIARKAGRRDVWMHLTLVAIRIEWELGHYSNVEKLAIEGVQEADFYKLNSQKCIMEIWYGRSILAQHKKEGKSILEAYAELSENDTKRESLAYLAEHAWLNNSYNEARELIKRAADGTNYVINCPVDTDIWLDGYYPIEGRLGLGNASLDALGENITAMIALFNSHESNPQSRQYLDNLINQLEKNPGSPFSHTYALCIALSIPENETTKRLHYMRQAFMTLQARAARMDNTQIKQSWLENNPWNKLLINESRKMKFH